MKDIKNYEGLYAITSCGKVWSYRRKKFLAPRDDKDGYQRVNLCKDGQQKTFFIHRLVAEAYIPNPDNKPQINHKDEVKTNNYLNNLEWATSKENVNYGTRNERSAKSRSIPVYCVELDKVFSSMKEGAQALGLQPGNISACCAGRAKTTGGYHWRYAIGQEATALSRVR